MLVSWRVKVCEVSPLPELPVRFCAIQNAFPGKAYLYLICTIILSTLYLSFGAEFLNSYRLVTFLENDRMFLHDPEQIFIIPKPGNLARIPLRPICTPLVGAVMQQATVVSC